MKKLLFVLFTLFLLAWHKNAWADGYSLVSNSALQSQHDWNSIGLSYGIFMLSFGASTAALKFKPWDARFFSFVATMIAMSVYSMNSNGPNAPLLNGHDIAMNALGALSAAATTWVFHFNEPPQSINDWEKSHGH